VIREHLRQILRFSFLRGFSGPMSRKWGFVGENKGRGAAILTPNELVLTLGGLHVSVQFGDNRRRNATVRVSTDGQTHTHTHTHTHMRTDAKRFHYLSHAICYSYGADNNQMILFMVLSSWSAIARVHPVHLMHADIVPRGCQPTNPPSQPTWTVSLHPLSPFISTQPES